MQELKHKYSFYIPHSCAAADGTLVALDMDYHLNEIISHLLEANISGVSIVEETGYYKHSNGSTNKMTTSVLYFFSEEPFEYQWILDYIKTGLKQETVLMIEDGRAFLCE